MNGQAFDEFKQRIRDMSDEEIRLGLDTNAINLAWKRSTAELELERRERERQDKSDLAKANQRIAELQTELSNVRWQTIAVWVAAIAGWVVAAISLLGLFD